MHAPLIIAQGANDPRVKRAESDQLYNALRGKGPEVQYFLYEGGFVRPCVIIFLYEGQCMGALGCDCV
jgi:hypothetical protein